jgi:hypothetical protein
MRTWYWVGLLGVLVVLMIVLTIPFLGGAGWTWPPGGKRVQVIVYPGPTIHVEASSPEPGVIVYSAIGWVPHPYRSAKLHFYASLSRVDDTGHHSAKLWIKDINDPASLTQARKGVDARPVLPEQRITGLEPGTYSLLVGLRDNPPSMMFDERTPEEARGIAGNSVWVEVPGP